MFEIKKVIIGFFCLLIIEFIHGQKTSDFTFELKIKHIDTLDFKEGFTKLLHEDENLYMLNSTCQNPSSSRAIPTNIKVYNSDGVEAIYSNILPKNYYATDFIIKDNRFYLCGRYFSNDTLKDISYKDEFIYTEGFIAELSNNLELIKLKRFPGTLFKALTFANNSLYILGEQTQKHVILMEDTLQSFTEFEVGDYDEFERDYNDVVLLKADTNFNVEKVEHFAIDGSGQSGQALVVNNNGYVVFSVHTDIVRGPDHHDGNLFLVDDNFKLQWHKQYTDLCLGEYQTKPIWLSKKNKVLAYVNSYYRLTSKDATKLPSYENLGCSYVLSEKKEEFNGIIQYSIKGKEKIIYTKSTPFSNEFLTTGITVGREDKSGYIYLEFSRKDSSAKVKYYQIAPDGTIIYPKELPINISPFLYYYYRYRYAVWEILFFEEKK